MGSFPHLLQNTWGPGVVVFLCIDVVSALSVLYGLGTCAFLGQLGALLGKISQDHPRQVEDS